MWEYNNSDELYHWGIKGMKWGVRRYRNEDGTLTDAGKKRYAEQDPVHEDYAKAHDNKSVKAMSDAELRARNNRLQMEQQYEKLTEKTSAGKKAVIAFTATAASLTAIGVAIDQYRKFGERDDVKKVVKKLSDFAVDKFAGNAPQKVKAKAAAVAMAYQIAKGGKGA